MAHNQFTLLKTRRFLPLFITQFLGAFNDNIFKNALVILIAYVLAEQAGLNSQLMITAAAGVFILPFFLFSATAGQLADKYEKTQLIRIIKLAEIIIMLGATVAFYMENVALLMSILFLMGIQSSFFGPVKYGILPEKLEQDELISGNGLIEAGTFLAILIGTIIGGLLILTSQGIWIVSALLLAVASLGWVSSWYIPRGQAADPGLIVNFNFIQETWNIVKNSRKNRDVFLSILGISWFWLVGATFLAQFPTYAKDIIGGNEQLVTLFLTVFSIGIGIGSLLCNKLLRGEIVATYVPLGILGMTLFTVDLYFASQHTFNASPEEMIGAAAFLSHATSWRILADMFLISVCSGIYIVPLYAILQSRSEPSHRSRTIASNNILNALFMVVSAIGTAIMLISGFSVTQVFLTIAILNAAVAVYICKLLPDALIKSFLQWIFTTLYKVEIKGLENYKKLKDEKVIIISNHLSLLDPVLISAYAPDKLTFAINTFVAKLWPVRILLFFVETFPLDPTNPNATRSLIEKIKAKTRVVIFPEGRITVTGSLMKIYEGPGMIADKADAWILPVRIDGAQYTPFSRLKGKVRTRMFPKITLTFLEPQKLNLPEELTGRPRRFKAGAQLYDLMSAMIFESSDYRKTLFQSILDVRSVHGKRHVVAEDIDRKPLTSGQLVTRSFILGEAIARTSQPGEYIGVLLPNAVNTLITFFALQAYGRVPTMLNFSTGSKNILAACATAQIKTVYTSRRFIDKAELQNTESAILESEVALVYLEDLAKTISLWDKLTGLIKGQFPQATYKATHKVQASHLPATVLFTSGSEGMPKGVVLSHENLQANCSQAAARVDFGPRDTILNALPMFHSFGLTGATLLPLLAGAKIFLYPSPLHYRVIPEMSYESGATILFGTDTFLSGYAKHGHPYDFYSLRYVFAGAEKLKDETRRIWVEKFGLRLLEGYGATETSPILSLNTPMQNKPHTVGRFLPGIEYKLEPVPGIKSGGRLWVHGPNVMLGYLLADNPGVLVPPKDGWYDTGDVVDIDDEGYITIKGRLKRFAKVGGEMVSLAAVENLISSLWPEYMHVVVSIPDEKKGEQLVLVTDYPDANREAIIAHIRESGTGEINNPKKILTVDQIPLLATGKIDYVESARLVTDGKE